MAETHWVELMHRVADDDELFREFDVVLADENRSKQLDALTGIATNLGLELSREEIESHLDTLETELDDVMLVKVVGGSGANEAQLAERRQQLRQALRDMLPPS